VLPRRPAALGVRWLAPAPGPKLSPAVGFACARLRRRPVTRSGRLGRAAPAVEALRAKAKMQGKVLLRAEAAEEHIMTQKLKAGPAWSLEWGECKDGVNEFDVLVGENAAKDALQAMGSAVVFDGPRTSARRRSSSEVDAEVDQECAQGETGEVGGELASGRGASNLEAEEIKYYQTAFKERRGHLKKFQCQEVEQGLDIFFLAKQAAEAEKNECQYEQKSKKDNHKRPLRRSSVEWL